MTAGRAAIKLGHGKVASDFGFCRLARVHRANAGTIRGRPGGSWLILHSPAKDTPTAVLRAPRGRFPPTKPRSLTR
jgi:hypothetical protein